MKFQDIKHNELTFQLIVESTPSAIVLVNKEGKIAYANSKSETLFGYYRSELIGQQAEVLIPKRYHKNYPGLRKIFSKAPATSAANADRELCASRKDGTEFPIEIGLNPIVTVDGTMVFASITDITERKAQESIIKKQVSELEIKNKELEHFAYIASHDLQEPLRTVSNYLQILKEDYSEQFDQNALKYLNRIDSASKRMSSLVKGLLDFSRVEKDKKLESLDCKKIIEEVIADLDILIRNSGAHIKVGEMPILNVYETEMRQLFQNLISNAIKFRKRGERPQVEILSERINDQWKFSVIDNGIGVATKHFEKIFHIFQRLRTDSECEGNGIGLANCKKIVELHGGKIWIESTLGKGATFHFTI